MSMRNILFPALKIAIGLFVLLLAVALFTNPDKESFKQKVRLELNQRVSEATDNPVLGYIADMGMEFSDAVVEHLVERENYYICSIYSLDLPDGTYRYLGAFGLFFPLQQKDPFEDFTSSH